MDGAEIKMPPVDGVSMLLLRVRTLRPNTGSEDLHGRVTRRSQRMRRALIIFVLFLAYCSHVGEYSVAIENRTGRQITDADLFYRGANFLAIGGSIAPGSGGVHLAVRAPIPESATVQWRTPDGVLHRQEVEVRRNVPRNFARGRIFFVVRADHTVEVRTAPPAGGG